MPSSLSDSLETDEAFNELFCREATRVPETLRKLYFEELVIIIRGTQAKIEKLAKVRAVSTLDEVQRDIDGWVENKRKKEAHSRYVKYMDTYHLPNQQPPHSFEYFIRTVRFAKSTIYEKWLIIEKKGLIPGSKIRHQGKILVVRGITRDCDIFFEDQRGSIGPFGLHIVQENDQDPKASNDK